MMRKLCLVMFIVPSAVSAFCFEEAGYHYNVSPKLLRAISQVESSVDPSAYNENKNASGEVVSRDYGLMQINSYWFSRFSEFNVDESNIYDPCLNVSLGAWVLASNFASHGYNWNSVGAYNAGFSKRNERARRIYVEKVQSVYYSLSLR